MSRLDLFPSPPPKRIVSVLTALPVGKAYAYAVPEGMEVGLGDYVRVPVGRRTVEGVVWAEDVQDGIDPAKLKYIEARHDLPPMSAAQRGFVEKVAAYTMADAGQVLKMCLGPEEAADPPEAPRFYTLAPGAGLENLTAPRARVLAVLSDGPPRRLSDLAALAGCTPGVVTAMAKAGLIVSALPPAPALPRFESVALSPAQEEAARSLRRCVSDKTFSATLLDGVTGSGKTEVYFEAVAEALAQGRQALILLPEIALSAQFVARFRRRFGVDPALWHSEVTPAKRRDVWRGVAAGEVKVVAGARSALFLPFAALSLVIVDEEHDASYKQEEGVIYHARDMAVLRARTEGCAVVLASATPSLETALNAQSGKYGVLRLPARHGGATLPEAKIIDLRRDAPPRGKFLAEPLRAALAETLAAGEQSLLFLNRRGYAPLTLCRTCGHRFQCPSCTAWLVAHRSSGRLHCHHCGHAQATPPACPSCGDEGTLTACGPGVERIEEEVRDLLPQARTLVLASDVLSGGALRDAVAAIEARDVDIVIGTQIVAKGHHFPSLTLAGVVDADLGLAGGDPRAAERTFQMLHQVAGRAGRGDRPGRVLLQSYMPEQAVIQALAAGDRDGFLKAEAAERARGGLPPFGRLAAVILSGADAGDLDRYAQALSRVAPRYDDVRVLGPVPAPLALLRGRHRRRFLVKTGRDVAPQKYLSAWLDLAPPPRSVEVKTDIDPQSFF